MIFLEEIEDEASGIPSEEEERYVVENDVCASEEGENVIFLEVAHGEGERLVQHLECPSFCLCQYPNLDEAYDQQD